MSERNLRWAKGDREEDCHPSQVLGESSQSRQYAGSRAGMPDMVSEPRNLSRTKEQTESAVP